MTPDEMTLEYKKGRREARDMTPGELVLELRRASKNGNELRAMALSDDAVLRMKGQANVHD